MAHREVDDGGGRRMFRLGAAGVILGSVLVLAGWLAVTGPPRHPRPGATLARSGDSPAGAAGCGLAPGPAGIPTRAPADVSWSLVGAGLEPSSPTAGPGVVDGPVARCYAHTPTGALLAAVQIPDRLSLAGRDRWEAIAQAQLAAGPGRDLFITETRALFAGPPPAGAGAWPAQVAAFKVVSYTDDRSTVAVVYRTEAGVLVVSDVTVAWTEGDWKVALLPDGTFGRPSSVIPSIDGYVEFRGV